MQTNQLPTLSYHAAIENINNVHLLRVEERVQSRRFVGENAPDSFVSPTLSSVFKTDNYNTL